MSSTELSQIPGLSKNIARVKRVEDGWRARAFLPELEKINGVEVLQLTLEHLTELERVNSPFITQGIGSQPEDVGLFLWIVSPHYDRFNVDLRRQFLTQLLENYPPLKFKIFYRAIYRFLWVRALMDIPSHPSSGVTVGTCTAAAMIFKIARAMHGWSRNQILKCRMAELYQYLKWDSLTDDPDRPQFNPLQDRMRQYYVERIT